MLVDMPNCEGVKLKISWQHNTAKDDATDDRHTTVCILDQMKDGESLDKIHKGTAYCSLKDRYNKEVGRKVSLTRALQQWDRKERAKIWKAYFARKA